MDDVKIKTECQPIQNDNLPSVVMDKIKAAIESDENLSAGFFFEFQETSKMSLPCARVFRATIQVTANIPL